MINLILIFFLLQLFYSIIGIFKRKIVFLNPLNFLSGSDYRVYTGSSAVLYGSVVSFLVIVTIYFLRGYIGNLSNVNYLFLNALLGFLTALGLYKITIEHSDFSSRPGGYKVFNWRNVIVGTVITVVLFILILLFNQQFPV